MTKKMFKKSPKLLVKKLPLWLIAAELLSASNLTGNINHNEINANWSKVLCRVVLFIPTMRGEKRLSQAIITPLRVNKRKKSIRILNPWAKKKICGRGSKYLKNMGKYGGLNNVGLKI